MRQHVLRKLATYAWRLAKWTHRRLQGMNVLWNVYMPQHKVGRRKASCRSRKGMCHPVACMPIHWAWLAQMLKRFGKGATASCRSYLRWHNPVGNQLLQVRLIQQFQRICMTYVRVTWKAASWRVTARLAIMNRLWRVSTYQMPTVAASKWRSLLKRLDPARICPILTWVKTCAQQLSSAVKTWQSRYSRGLPSQLGST